VRRTSRKRPMFQRWFSRSRRDHALPDSSAPGFGLHSRPDRQPSPTDLEMARSRRPHRRDVAHQPPPSRPPTTRGDAAHVPRIASCDWGSAGVISRVRIHWLTRT
jgi:hypothetical protein